MARPSRPVRESIAQIRKNGRWRRPNDFMRMRTTLISWEIGHGSDAWQDRRVTGSQTPLHSGDGAGPEPTAAPRPASFRRANPVETANSCNLYFGGFDMSMTPNVASTPISVSIKPTNV